MITRLVKGDVYIVSFRFDLMFGTYVTFRSKNDEIALSTEDDLMIIILDKYRLELKGAERDWKLVRYAYL